MAILANNEPGVFVWDSAGVREKMDLIISALIEAGYFRARISTLSDFDKVIGGMAWAMQVFSQDIDINIFYRDTLDLGQKIALTERLVMVLLVMNCPHKIEPHQIVGLDHTNLLPVIKWLIKRSSEIRREHEAFNRLLALRHYHRVTNTLAQRGHWCHVLKVEQLKNLSAKQTKSDTTTMGDPEGVNSEADLNFIERLKNDFKDNQSISLVDSQPAFITTSADYRASQTSDGNESDFEQDRLSEQSDSDQTNQHQALGANDVKLSPARVDEDPKIKIDNTNTRATDDEQFAPEQGLPEIVALHR